MKKYFLIAFFYVGAISMLVMSMHFFQYEVSGILKNKPIASNALYRWCFKAHILFGIIAIFLGPAQFLTNIKAKYFAIHRKMGYVYFIAVYISSIAGLIVAQYAMGGIWSKVGFSLLALFWFITATMALIAIKRRDIEKHKMWMYLNYGLTFAAIPQRTMLLIPLYFDASFMDVYRCSAWFPWILNTIIAVYIFRKYENPNTVKSS